MTDLISIAQLVPRVGGGVADHAAKLKAVWAARGVPSTVQPVRTPADIEALKVGSGEVIFVHMSGYGYARWGLCWWLPRALLALKRASRQPPTIAIYFHEIYATGQPWRSAFWTCIPQKLIARSMIKLADVVITNSELHRDRLLKLGAQDPTVLPVFSNVGEPHEYPVKSGRAAVIFGSAASRKKVAALISSCSGTLHPFDVIEIGPPPSVAGERLATRFLGELSPEMVSISLSKAILGICWAALDELNKSSVYAAYAAHGCAPMVLSTKSHSGPVGQSPYLLPDEAEIAQIEQIGRQAFEHYQSRRSELQGADILSLLSRCSPTQNRTSNGSVE